jgi:hypothetical protein
MTQPDERQPRTHDETLIHEKGLTGSAHVASVEFELSTQTAEEIADSEGD